MARSAALVTETVGGSSDHQREPRLRPFLRWAGGKYYLTKRLLELVPADVAHRTYYEPFLGAANLFFALRHPRAVLSDLNSHLVECYRAICENPKEVWRALRNHKAHDSEAHYYRVRDLYNESDKSVTRAAQFLYLNRTGFNGVFRVNLSGRYNVPYGKKHKPRFPSRADLVAVSEALRGARLAASDYRVQLQTAGPDDFVYLDPPYPPLNGTSFFQHYTRDRFDAEDQKRVAECVRELDGRGCLVMVSNADTPLIRELYAGFAFQEVAVRRYVSTHNTKHFVGELIITNY